MAATEVEELLKKAHAVWKGRISFFNKVTAVSCGNVFHSKDEQSVSYLAKCLPPLIPERQSLT